MAVTCTSKIKQVGVVYVQQGKVGVVNVQKVGVVYFQQCASKVKWSMSCQVDCRKR